MATNFIIYIILIIIAIILGIWNRKDYPKFAWPLIGLLLLSLVIELSKIEWSVHKNMLTTIYYIGEVIFLGGAYFQALKSAEVKKGILFSSIVFPIVYTTLMFVNDSESNLLIMLSISHIYFLILGIIYVFETYLPPFEEGKLIRNPFFWINTANLFLFSGLFLQLALDTYVKSFSLELSDKLHIINEVINYVYYTLFSIGFVCKRVFK